MILVTGRWRLVAGHGRTQLIKLIELIGLIKLIMLTGLIELIARGAVSQIG